MTHTKNIPDKARSGFSILLERLRKHSPDKGFFILAGVLVLLSAFAAADFSQEKTLLVAGDIALNDILADRSFLFEDRTATNAKKLQVKSLQPLVLDLVSTPANELREDLHKLFLDINQADGNEMKEVLRVRLSQELGEDISPAALDTLAAPKVQSEVLDILLPLLEKELHDGALGDTRVLLPYKGGIIIRNLDTGEEALYSDAQSVPDMKSLEQRLAAEVKILNLSAREKRTVSQVLAKALRPTLIPNYETTHSRAAAAEAAIQPVLLRVQRGEVLIRQGEQVTAEEQLKMQSLLQRQQKRFNGSYFMGVAACALLLSVGLLFSPSSRKGHSMRTKDFIFLVALLTIFAFAAKGASILAEQLAQSNPTFAMGSLAYAVPAAGAAALSSMLFAARRYVLTGLLLSFFCSIMSGGGLGLFLFHFMACMWSTWIIGRTYSRQDVVKAFLPMLAGLFAMWFAATFFQGGLHTRYLQEAIAVVINGILSMFLTFALAPVVEMAFGYTTRFRLMELLNLEQPLLRDLMLSAPGTYHHSLIVSNMVEAGAKAVGANGLLCKVAALYHDIGKISKAAYFIENQGTEENPHTKLSPSMSALILISHVKKGTDSAHKHRLGPEVTDIIRQHHGSGLIQYFYQKALKQTDTAPPKIEDFCYPGPKPQSREAALIMLADAVEASSRTLDDPTPNRLKQHTEAIIKNIYASGQLDETELTFRDLDKLTESFYSVLRGIFHHRISYPDKEGEKETGKDRPQNNVADASADAKAPVPPNGRDMETEGRKKMPTETLVSTIPQ